MMSSASGASRGAAGRQSLPKIGFGTYGMEGKTCRRIIEDAIGVGYRLFDSAEIYGNETEVGEALARSAVSRNEFFVISKFWFTNNDPDSMRRALHASLSKMQLERFDLYMLHWPSESMDINTLLKALDQEKINGRIDRIGICNFPVSWLQKLVDESAVAVDAVECEWHVYLDQNRLHRFLESQGIPFIAYCPLAQGRVMEDAALAEIGRKHGVSASAVALAWLISHHGVTAIPKAAARAHQIANLAATQIDLTREELEIIESLPKNCRIANFEFAPPWDA